MKINYKAPPEAIKVDNEYPCKECGGHALHRASSTGLHYYKCTSCDNRTMYAPLKSICQFDWAFENSFKKCIECNNLLNLSHKKSCFDCLEPICKDCQCSNCNTIKV